MPQKMEDRFVKYRVRLEDGMASLLLLLLSGSELHRNWMEVQNEPSLSFSLIPGYIQSSCRSKGRHQKWENNSVTLWLPHYLKLLEAERITSPGFTIYLFSTHTSTRIWFSSGKTLQTMERHKKQAASTSNRQNKSISGIKLLRDNC